MKRSPWTTVLVLPILLVGLAACGDDDPTPPPPGPETFSLTFEGDATFQSAHGDQTIYVALEDAQGEVTEFTSGTVSATDDPSFSFTFEDALTEGEEYAVKYWIDSNFQEGDTEGVCDPPAGDHQWNVPVDPVSEDVVLAETHEPGETTEVCDGTFALTLEFSGDDTFQSAHGDQAIEVAVVHEGLESVVATQTGTVAAEGDQSFAFTFDGNLTRGADYHVDYWIDSNFDGGTQGTCDPPANDHQWRIDAEMEEGFGSVDADVAFEDTHRPGETEDVCATFEGS